MFPTNSDIEKTYQKDKFKLNRVMLQGKNCGFKI